MLMQYLKFPKVIIINKPPNYNPEKGLKFEEEFNIRYVYVCLPHR